MAKSDLAKLYQSIRTAERRRVIEHLFKHTPREEIYDDPFLVRTHAFLRTPDEAMRADRLRHISGMVARMEGKDLPRAWHPTEQQIALPGFGEDIVAVGKQAVFSGEDELIASKVLRTEVNLKNASLIEGIVKHSPLIDVDPDEVQTALTVLLKLMAQA